MDALEWIAKRQQFPSLLLLRRYLKLVIEMSLEKSIMNTPLSEAPKVPYTLSAIPIKFPPPGQLRLWVNDLPHILSSAKNDEPILDETEP